MGGLVIIMYRILKKIIIITHNQKQKKTLDIYFLRKINLSLQFSPLHGVFDIRKEIKNTQLHTGL